ncbi:hypothetical protein NW768_004195 [Fusarium equiseti]|uniref:Uncharacterized protein n=1 Tax=Fusarium equiseti TaxID=61235 RepID=A0ABQ8RJS9_FUSEQ|nr:hypothetical protein NW768_004195 [Fusarium equiseti]
MSEFLGPAGSLTNVTYHIITLLIECRQATDQVRRSLELIRTCDRDLQHLITLREEHLDILERKPIELVRVNSIIEDAHIGLLDVGRIIEKCRPEAHRGKMPYFRRGMWVMFDAEEFNSQVPVINGHHQSVLTEIQFLRFIAFHIPPVVQKQAAETGTKVVRKKKIDIGNISLLIDLIGPKPVATPATSPDTDACPPDSQKAEPISQRPPSRPPKPPLYTDPNYIAASSSKHINFADIQASRGHPTIVYDALWSTPHSPAANFDAIPPDVDEEWWSTGPEPAQYVLASQVPTSRPPTQDCGSNSSPRRSPNRLPTASPHVMQPRKTLSSETRLVNPRSEEFTNTARS